MTLTRLRAVNLGLLLAVATLLLVLGRLQAAVPATELAVPVHINVGGPALTDSTGRAWLADGIFSSATGYGHVDFNSVPSFAVGAALAPVAGTEDDLVFATARQGMDAFTVNLPNGAYDLTLHFAEVAGATSAGQRVANIFVEGVHAIDSLDVYARVGPSNALSLLVPSVVVTDAQLKMVFVAKTGSPRLSGLSVSASALAPSGTPPPTPTLRPASVINANIGGNGLVGADGAIWLADRPFDPSAGWGYIDDGGANVIDRRTGNLWLDIAGTDDDGVFATARNGVDRYDFTLAPGVYSVDFLFTETDFTVGAPGHRLFDVIAQGVTVLDDFDILATAGGYQRAVMATVDAVSVTGGTLTIRFLNASGTVDEPGLGLDRRSEISGISIRPFTPPPPPTATPTPAPPPTPTATTVPTPTPVLPTPTPPSLGAGPPPPPPGGPVVLFPPLLPSPTPTPSPTAAPTPTATPRAPATSTGSPSSGPQPTVEQPTPGPNGGTPATGVGGVVAGTSPGTAAAPGRATLALASAGFEGADQDVVVLAILSASRPVSGLTLALRYPAGVFEVAAVETSSTLVEAGFDGRALVNHEAGELRLGGGFAIPVTLEHAELVRLRLTVIADAEPGVHLVEAYDLLVRDADRKVMDVALPEPLTLRLRPVENLDARLDADPDANRDGLVDLSDLDLLSLAYGSGVGDARFDERADLNRDGLVDLRDLAIMGAGYAG